MRDINIFSCAKKEKSRQSSTISLIASENKIYPELLKLASYPLTNKYSEGYPNKRFYAGCKNIDLIEQAGIDAAKKAFGCEFANIQCYSGSIANFAIYKALLKSGDVILSMEMSSGGHLTHSSPVSFVTSFYKVFTYSINPNTFRLDYEDLKEKALKYKPNLIIAGSSSYPFQIDFKKFREIADLVGAYLFADICHYSAFIISGLHPHCFPYAHIAMCTTHKQLRGARGAIILWNDEKLTPLINKSVFPGLQGGMNPSNVAMNALALQKANSEEFKDYSNMVLKNAKYLANRFKELGVEVVGNDTETHMLLINVKKSYGITGKKSSEILEKAGIIVNQNLIPFDTESPLITSGIRLGTLSISTLGFTKETCEWLVDQIHKLLSFRNRLDISECKKQIKSLLKNIK